MVYFDINQKSLVSASKLSISNTDIEWKKVDGNGSRITATTMTQYVINNQPGNIGYQAVFGGSGFRVIQRRVNIPNIVATNLEEIFLLHKKKFSKSTKERIMPIID